MSRTYPYTLYVCPCSDSNGAPPSHDAASEYDQDRAFNPHDPQSPYALYPLDYLLFCDDCNQIRCPRCVSEEVLNWYCPNCLFETHSTGVRADGNRCSRNCYNCPICASPAIVSRHDEPAITQDKQDDETYILACHYCSWTSLQAGLKFNRPTKITEQISKARKEKFESVEGEDGRANEAYRSFHNENFDKISTFYREQVAEHDDIHGRGGSAPYGSPANLARIIHMYGGLSHKALSKAQDKPRPMREARATEGLTEYDTEVDEDHIIDRMQQQGLEGTVSRIQQEFTPANLDARFTNDLWPSATMLRTRRGKRCRQCRQFVVRPDTKVTGLRYRIRILALNNIPRLSVRPLDASKLDQYASFALRNEQRTDEVLTRPFSTQQYVLTLRNPIFETVKVTLATPGTTPGRVASKVTILCPTFSVGPAGDLWDDALTGSTMSVGLGDGGRKAAMASLTGNVETDRQPEAGKVWEQTRNSTSVILEVVAGSLAQALESQQQTPAANDDVNADLLEIPIYVRVEWTAEGTDEKGQKGKPEAKEISYWCVAGVGRLAE